MITPEEEAFEGVNELFGTTYDEATAEKAVVKIEKEITSIVDKKEEIKNNLVTMQDTPYIRQEIMSLVQSSTMIVGKLETDLKVGSPARMYEVYATLLNSVTNALKELRQLNLDVANLEVDQTKKMTIEDVKGPDDKISLSAGDLLKMVKAAGENSEISQIDADFKIEDSYDESVKKKGDKDEK